MYIQVEVETPKSLTKRQRELLEEFERESHKETSPESAGFLSRVKDSLKARAADDGAMTSELLFFAGSARAGSYNKKVARLGAMIAEANGIPSTFLDLGDYPMPLYNGDLEAAEGQPENAKKLTAVMQVHSGIFIVSPEYNASITPLLKNTLDWVSHVRRAPRPSLQDARVRARIGFERRHGRPAQPHHRAPGSGARPWRARAARSVRRAPRQGRLRRGRAPDEQGVAGELQGA